MTGRFIMGALAAAGILQAQSRPAAELLLRLDDVGMNSAVNGAIERVARTGMPFSASVLFVAPKAQEAIEILKRYPRVSVGVHLALNAEWKDYRWGPVLGAAAVPTLVDSQGYFFPSTAAFLAHGYDLAEVERELNAQVERALKSGLKVDYVDYHMATAIATPPLRAIVERVAAKHHLGISRYFGESVIQLFGVSPDKKLTTFVNQLGTLGANAPTVAVIHVAQDTPEMRALVDLNNPLMNTGGGEPLTWVHRSAELEMLLSRTLRRRLRKTGARLVTYRDVIRERGLDSMKP